MGGDVYPALLLAALDLGVDVGSGYEALCEVELCGSKATFGRGNMKVCALHVVVS